jgi:hypothetical protein
MSHEEIQSLLGAYALDAVDGPEADLVELHLRECPRCRAEVAEHRETAALLASGPAPTPVHIWDDIAAGLETTPAGEPGRAVLLRPRRWPERLAVAMAGAAAIVFVVVGVLVVDQRNRIDRIQAALEDRSVVAAAIAAEQNPAARRVELRSADGVVLARAVLTPDGTGYLWSDGLPRLDAARTYQLWAIVGTEKISAGVLGSAPGVVPFRVAGHVLALAVTEESAGGVVASQNQPVASGAIRSA